MHLQRWLRYKYVQSVQVQLESLRVGIHPSAISAATHATKVSCTSKRLPPLIFKIPIVPTNANTNEEEDLEDRTKPRTLRVFVVACSEGREDGFGFGLRFGRRSEDGRGRGDADNTMKEDK